jgi:hypothetical protein
VALKTARRFWVLVGRSKVAGTVSQLAVESTEKSSEHGKRSHGDLVKIAVNLPPADWHSYGLETMWAEPIGGDRYRLQNVPFYAYGLSAEDVVVAKNIGGQLIVQKTVQPSYHSTYRAFLAAEVTITSDNFLQHWMPLQELGATFEQRFKRLLAIDIPASSDISAAYALLENGADAGVWDFEEAHCGHLLDHT